jgi:hypothetical protein
MKRKSNSFRNYDGWTREDFEHDLRTYPPYLKFYENYDKTSIEKFIKDYSEKKAQWYKYKDDLLSKADNERTQFFKDAELFLTIILQKKLFNLQCLWRARQIELPFVEYTTDFEYFGKHILECPFLDPISEKEIEVAISFLKKHEEHAPFHWDKWQAYDEFKNCQYKFDKDRIAREGDSDDIEFMDTGGLFELPDVRYQEEKYYQNIWREEYARVLKAEKDPNAKPYVYIPSLYGYMPEVFVEGVEDPVTIDLFQAENNRISRDDAYDLKIDMEFLLTLRNRGETIAFVEDEDWYEAIKRTIKKVTQNKIAEFLPYVYDAYLLQFEDDDWEALKKRRIKNFKFSEKGANWDLHSYWRENVIKGKRLAGLL